MLEHLQRPQSPARVVILGAAGFVGYALYRRLQQMNDVVIGFTRQQIDLLNSAASAQLADILKPEDVLVVISAEAPCKDAAMLYRNIKMMHTVCEVLTYTPVKHVIYISSDAVYADSAEPLTEMSVTAPTSLHGIMHLTREMMLQSVSQAPLAILRCSLLYGASDPHNGYGPNRFRRLVANKQPIVLFGEGEEQRDHVYIDDVAEIIIKVIQHRSRGICNVATGHVVSFRYLAEKIVALAPSPVEIRTSPRVGVMPHNGYRAFDNRACQQAFPDFTYTPIDIGLPLAQTDGLTPMALGK